MNSGDSVLRSLKDILEGSRRYKELDAAVSVVSNKGKRLAVIEEIQKIEAELEHRLEIPLQNPVLQTTTLVWSHRDPIGQISLSSYDDFRLVDLVYHTTTINDFDSASDRYLYYEEYRQRVHKLKEAILKGTMDEFLAFSPLEMIHRVMGLRGELLGVLGLDPYTGITFKKLDKLPEVPEQIQIDGWGGLKAIIENIANARARVNIKDVAEGTAIDVAEGIPQETPTKNYIKLNTKKAKIGIGRKIRKQ